MSDNKPKNSSNSDADDAKTITVQDQPGQATMTPEEQEFIRKIREQLALEDDESAVLVAAYLKNIP